MWGAQSAEEWRTTEGAHGRRASLSSGCAGQRSLRLRRRSSSCQRKISILSTAARLGSAGRPAPLDYSTSSTLVFPTSTILSPIFPPSDPSSSRIMQQQQQLQQLDAVVWADRDRLALASPRIWKTPRTRVLPTARQLSVNGARPRPMLMPVASQQYVSAGGACGEVHAPVTVQAPLESSTSICTEKPRSSSFVLGDYTLGKMLSAGSLDKVKLVYRNPAGEKMISPAARSARDQDPLASQHRKPRMNNVAPTAEAASKQAPKEILMETRTIREAALSMLLHRPYYINGGQVLDYIISHGRLRERVSRKFSAPHSAIVTATTSSTATSRSRTSSSLGNSKIISMFAAHELLNANVVTEPQVDIRSFGVALYVLVCGKLPFDNQSMPALHAEIECGLVECPMLAVILSARALAEILSCPWMIRGHGSPPDAHMLHSKPLRTDELDRQSGVFARAVQPGRRNGRGGLSNASLACYDSALSAGSGSGRVCDTPAATPSKSRHFSGFDFYRHKLFSPGSSLPDTPTHPTPVTSSSRFSHASLVDMQSEFADPTGGFYSLVSMHFLALEKLERERVYGHGHLASSQMPLLGKDDGLAPPPSALNPLPASANAKTNGRSSQPHITPYNMHAVPSPALPNFDAMAEAAAASPSHARATLMLEPILSTTLPQPVRRARACEDSTTTRTVRVDAPSQP
ncbi:hypothetical protein DFH11DRAFT_1725782 [Phellopilus nigrolimitatus]|nr:hypothetical protein DFH11DRAFT_1725782 [Phellopilus nigrolimitatus]